MASRVLIALGATFVALTAVAIAMAMDSPPPVPVSHWVPPEGLAASRTTKMYRAHSGRWTAVATLTMGVTGGTVTASGASYILYDGATPPALKNLNLATGTPEHWLLSGTGSHQPSAVKPVGQVPGTHDLLYFPSTFGNLVTGMTPTQVERLWARSTLIIVPEHGRPVTLHVRPISHEPAWPPVGSRTNG